MMYRIWTYLKFLLRSTNQHGVHSPFVYHYLTQCLYNNTENKGSRVHKVLMKSVPYLKLQSILLRTGNQEVQKQLSKAYAALDFECSPADLIYVGSNQLLHINSTWLNDHCHQQSMILLENIHQNSKTSAMWLALCENAWVTVSIDFYFGGIIFLRTAQRKQHFRIRI